MYFNLNYITHPIEKVNEVPATFFLESIHTTKFSNNLFPKWFIPVVNSAPKLKKKFKDVYEELFKLDVDQREQLHQRFIADMNVENICFGINPNPIYSLTDFPELHELLKVLFNHLYNETLQKSITLNAALKTSISDHFQQWKKGNNMFTVCPFCGLENYTSSNGTNRDPYDHWLCKDKYPLSAINFKNLIPIGDKCNQTAVKGNIDIIHSEKDYLRRPSFYPYNYNSNLKIQLVCKIPPTVGFKGDWDIIITPDDPLENSKVETWLAVFNLKERYISWLKTYVEAWKAEFHKYLTKQTIVLLPNAAQIKTQLINWRRGRDSNPRYTFGVYTLSRRALSTTQTPLRIKWDCKGKIILRSNQ
jgi:hypothetical protein